MAEPPAPRPAHATSGLTLSCDTPPPQGRSACPAGGGSCMCWNRSPRASILPIMHPARMKKATAQRSLIRRMGTPLTTLKRCVATSLQPNR